MTVMGEQRARHQVGTPLDDGDVDQYLIVAAILPEDVPIGRCALVLKRLEDDTRAFGVVEIAPNVAQAHEYVRALVRQHVQWEITNQRDEQTKRKRRR